MFESLFFFLEDDRKLISSSSELSPPELESDDSCPWCFLACPIPAYVKVSVNSTSDPIGFIDWIVS